MDGTALIQELSIQIPTLSTFGDLAMCILNKVVTLATNIYAESINFVTDHNPAVSIKGAERGKSHRRNAEKQDI